MRIRKHSIIIITIVTLLLSACQQNTTQISKIDGPTSDNITAISEVAYTTTSPQPVIDPVTEPLTQVETTSLPVINDIHPPRGNEFVNIWHEGYFAEYDGWYYISSQEDQATYKMRPDGSEKTLVLGEYIYQMNILDDWMYYSKYGVWKIHLDGTDKTLIKDRSKDTGHLQYLYVEDMYVYFLLLEDDGDSFYRMETDGSNKKRLLRGLLSEGFIDGGYYYFMTADDFSIVERIRLDGDGSDREQVYKHGTSINNFLVRGDDMYFTAYKEGIWHFDLTKKQATKLANDECRFYNFDDQWLYYESRSDSIDEQGKPDDTASFYKVRLDGTERQMISYRWPMNMYIPKGDWIYFLNVDKSEERSQDVSVTYLAKIRKDGTGFERLFEYHE